MPVRSARTRLAVALAVTLAAVVPAAPAPAATGWERVDPPPGIGSPAQLFAVSAAGPASAWAAGVERIGAGLLGEPLLLRLHRGRWTKEPLGVTWRGELRHVAAVSRTEVYAAGTDELRRPRVLRGDGATWHEEALPVPAGATFTVDTLAGAPGRRPWLLANSGGTLVLLRRTATGWRQYAVPPAPFTTRAITVDRRGVLWVAGYERAADGVSPAVRLYRYAGGVASPVTVAEPTPAMFPTSVVAGPDGVWVGGATPYGAPAIAGWDGRRWREARLDGPAFGAAGLVADARGRPAWALHTFAVGEDGGATPGYLERTGDTWVRRPFAPDAGEEAGPPVIEDVTAVPGTRTSVAVGWVGTTAGGVVPRIERTTG